MLDLAARGMLESETTLHTLEDAPRAYQDLAHGTVSGRAVVVPTDAYRP